MEKILITPTLSAILLAGVLIGGATLLSNRSTSEPQTDNEDVVIPMADSQPFDIKTDGDLKAELAILKASLDNLYTAHNNLVNDHNALLKYVNTTAVSSNKNVGAITNNSNLEIKVTSLTSRVTELERKNGLSSENTFSTSPSDKKISVLEIKINDLERTVDDFCGWVFGLNYRGCPFNPNSPSSISDRINKLERGY